MFNAFADAAENPELPGSDWDYTFSEQNGKTTVRITIYNESLARMEKMIEMGFVEGFKMTIDNLEKLLATLLVPAIPLAVPTTPGTPAGL